MVPFNPHANTQFGSFGSIQKLGSNTKQSSRERITPFLQGPIIGVN